MSNVRLMAGEAACELVAFDVNGQTFAVNVGVVREIRGWTPATPLPQSPDYMVGIVNLRGNMLPIIDLASRLGFQKTEPSDRHAIVVIEVRDQIVGLLVETVSELLTVPADIGDFAFKRLVRGVLPHNERMITLLILDGLISDEYLQQAA